MTWLSQNWFWVLFGLLFVGMHLGHGGHGSTPARNAEDANSPNAADKNDTARRRGGHRH